MTKSDLIARNNELENEVIILKNRLDKLERIVFGNKSEKFVAPDNQLTLTFDTDNKKELAEESEKESITYSRKKKKHPGRHPLPEHLPRQKVIIEPECDVNSMTCIGEEVTEVLCRIPGTTFVMQYIRKKYAQADGQGIVIGNLPTRA